jgi:threonine aldolase
MFYIGGTKNGAWCGEAVVITRPNLRTDFKYTLKQRGALLAKSSMFGIQFIALFKDELYFELARHANNMAQKLASGIRECGYGFLVNSPTNQIFPIFPNAVIKELQEAYKFYLWTRINDDLSCTRLVTSWATKEEKVDEFITDLKRLVDSG